MLLNEMIKVVDLTWETEGNRKSAYRIDTGIHEHVCSAQVL